MSKTSFRGIRISSKPPHRQRPLIDNESSSQPRYTSCTTKSSRLKSASFQSRTGSKRGQRSKLKETSELKEQLVTAWDAFNVPFHHRERFYKSISGDFKFALSRELDSINGGSALIISASNLIKSRETKLKELESLGESLKQGKEGFIAAVTALNEYRMLTLDTVEVIGAWAQSMKVSPLEFEWNGQDYLTKIKSDTGFLASSNLGKWFNFKETGDPFLLFPLEHKPMYRVKEFALDSTIIVRFTTASKQLKLVPARAHRIMYPRLRAKDLKKTQRRRTLPVDENAVEPKETVKVWRLDDTLTLQCSEEFYLKVCEEYIEETCEVVANSSAHEMITAALSLHSNSVLDRYLQEVLNLIVPSIQVEAYLEMKNEEYVGVRDDIFEEVKNEILNATVREVEIELLAACIAGSLVDSVNVLFVVEESVMEEDQTNLELAATLTGLLIQQFADKDWLEELAEGQLGQAYLDRSRLAMPIKMQVEIFNQEKTEIFKRVAEEIYFDLLNSFPGGVWVENIIKNCIAEASGQGSIEEFTFEDPESNFVNKKKKHRKFSRTLIR